MTIVAVDVGGTFTDFVVFDESERTITTSKVPSTRDDPARACLIGVKSFLAQSVTVDSITSFLHGSTITTNALIQNRGSTCGLLLNAALAGIYQVKTHVKYGGRYSVTGRRPPALIDETNVFEVPGRLDRNGEVVEQLDEEALREIGRQIAGHRLDAVAICFLFSYANPQHETRAKEIIESVAPQTRVFCSADILPRIREWARMSTTILDVYLESTLVSYIERLSKGLRDLGIDTKQMYLMESNGGVMPFTAAAAGGKAADTLFSGPAAAVQAAKMVSDLTGTPNLVTMDLGGTSCDIAFIQDGSALEVTDGEILGYDVHVPMVDIATVGAGGGTIARIDEDGRLRVGPESAGAVPGPACYGFGGDNATVTDADVVLGYLNPDYFLGGELVLDADRAQTVMRKLGESLNADASAAAWAVVRANDSRMADAIRVAASRRGVSLKECSFLVCGGAGPVHGAAVAEELGIDRVIIPESPGVFAALGLLCADVVQDYVRTSIVRLDDVNLEVLVRNFKELEIRALDDYQAQGIAAERVEFVREIDARYLGQGFEIRVQLDTDPSASDAIESIVKHFHDAHLKVYGHSSESEPVEIVSYRVRAKVVMPMYEASDSGDDSGSCSQRSARRVHFGLDSYEAEVVRRTDIGSSDTIDGPAVIEQADTTIVVPPGWSAACGPLKTLVLTRAGGMAAEVSGSAD